MNDSIRKAGAWIRLLLAVICVSGVSACVLTVRSLALGATEESEAVPAGGQDREVILENAYLRAVFRIGTDGVDESYYALRDGKTFLLAKGLAAGGVGATFFAADPDRGERKQVAPDLSQFFRDFRGKEKKYDEMPPEPDPGPSAAVLAIHHESADLLEEGRALTLVGRTASGDRISRTISLKRGEPFARIATVLEAKQALLLEYLDDRFTFGIPGRPDFTWTPQVKTIEQDLCPDWTWKAPAAFIHKAGLTLALIPDVADLAARDTWRRCNLTLDLDVRPEAGATLSFGLIPTRFHGHSLFKHIPGQRALIPPGKVSSAYYLLAPPDVASQQAHRPVVRFLWEKFGHEALLEGHTAQQYTFSQWEPKTWHTFADEMWYEVERNGVTCGSIRIDAFFPKNAWFCGWWNNMRTAHAMAVYAKRTGDTDVRAKADKILNMALDAPVHEGAFPVVFFETEEKGQFWMRDHFFGGIQDCYHTFDMSWTGYWLLKWRQEINPQEGRILSRCTGLGDFLCSHQQAGGFIPSYFNEDFSIREESGLNKVSAEPAACALFLAELYRIVGDHKYLKAATKAMEYVQEQIVPRGRWFDYETFLSCSRKPYDFYDSITDQYPQNNMATIQAAKAFLALFDATGERRLLERGENVLDYLSLTQQVWSHPIMTPNLIGGFTTQNTDAEWSDARQAYCAIVYLDYFDRCGKLEYLERGIAALRSGLAVAPYENWSHNGLADVPGVLSGFHWGQGSALASVEMVWERYGDIYADAMEGWAYGINGCTVRDFSVAGNTLRLQVETGLDWEQPARIVFRQAPEGMSTVIVNGARIDGCSREDLEKGIRCSITR